MPARRRSRPIDAALPAGARHVRGALDAAQQQALIADLARVITAAPFYTPTMPRTGKPLSIVMTNCGTLGWVTDKTGGYRYQATHPETGARWPAIPQRLIDIWRQYSDHSALPEACLINLYHAGTKLGSHVDGDEPNRAAPVVSVSLGLDAVFHVGGPRRDDPKVRVTLSSGDVFVLGNESRSAYHGIDRILATGPDLVSTLVPGGGRINLTMRRVSLG